MSNYNSIVLQLQEYCLNSEKKVTQLLDMAYLISRKLSLDETIEWITFERDGYYEIENPPDYRKLRDASLYGFNPYRGWIPVIILEQEAIDIFQTIEIKESVSEIESILNKSEGTIYYSFQNIAILKLNEMTQSNMAGYQQRVSCSSFESILSNVRNKILDWTISLEQQNILGEGLYFTKEEKESTNKLTNINIYGNQNQIMNESNESNQSYNINSELEIKSLKETLSKIEELIDLTSIKDEDKGYVKDLSSQINAEISKVEVDKDKVNSLFIKMKKKFTFLGKEFAKDFIIQGILYKLSSF